jgi:hypothetical protein
LADEYKQSPHRTRLNNFDVCAKKNKIIKQIRTSYWEFNMFSPKYSYTIFSLWMIIRSSQISGETKTVAFYARSKVVTNFEFISLDNVVTSVTNTQTNMTEILYSFLLRRVLKTKRHRLKAPLRTSQVCWSKRGQIYLSPDFHKDIDHTVYMDVESNPGPAQSDNINSRSTNNTNTAKISSNQGNIKIAHLNIRSLKNK